MHSLHGHASALHEHIHSGSSHRLERTSKEIYWELRVLFGWLPQRSRLDDSPGGPSVHFFTNPPVVLSMSCIRFSNASSPSKVPKKLPSFIPTSLRYFFASSSMMDDDQISLIAKLRDKVSLAELFCWFLYGVLPWSCNQFVTKKLANAILVEMT